MHLRKRVWRHWLSYARQSLVSRHESVETPCDASRLEDRTLFSGTPLSLDALELESFEDSGGRRVDLDNFFTIDNTGRDIEYSVSIEDGGDLLKKVIVNDNDVLILSLNENQHGEALLSVVGDDGLGNLEALPILLQVESINDAPTTTGIVDVSVGLDAERTVIDLYAAFNDVEDGPDGLKYSVVNNSNPGLFDAIKINQTQGRLILEHAANATGVADLTVVATDSGGLSVGMQSREDFRLFNQIYGINGTSPDTAELGLERLDLWTGWRFFELVDGSYKTDELATEKFRRYLTSPEYTRSDSTHVFNLETPDHVNTEEGRDNFAELLGFSKTVNPDLDIGVYRIMPERVWLETTNYARGLDQLEMGIRTFSSRTVDTYGGRLDEWQARNLLFRTEPVSEEFGGGTVAELIDTINPSVYTPDWDFVEHWRPVTLDATSNSLTLGGTGPTLDGVATIKLKIATDAQLENGLQEDVDYFLTNLDGMSFQISATPNGPAIDFGDEFDGRIYAAATGDLRYSFHDSNVQYWNAYAEENIKEARKFGKPVYAWISPSVSGLGVQQFSYDFVRWQLEVLRPIADGAVIYQSPAFDGSFYTQQSWWQAIADFEESLSLPANEFRVTVGQADPNNASPTAVADSVSATEDSYAIIAARDLLANDRDADPLRLASFTQPQHGTLTQLANGSLKYEPDLDFHGRDYFRYRATDGLSISNAALVEIDVANLNDRPVAEADSLSTSDGKPVAFRSTRLLANDIDVDGDSLAVRIFEQPQHGVISKNAAGAFVYTPDGQFVGQDEFSYQAFDGLARSKAATVVIDVFAQNDAPVAADDRFRLVEDGQLAIPQRRLLENDVDADADDLQVVVVKDPQHGELRRLESGALLYVPDANFAGTDQFYYRASDGELKSNLAKVELQVAGENDLPIARPDTLVTTEDTPLVFRDAKLLANDVDVDDENLRVLVVDPPDQGMLRRTALGSYVYTPKANFNGTDQFGYQLLDGEGRSQVVAVQIRVEAENDVPVARDNRYVVAAGKTLQVGGDGVLTNDYDADGDTLKARLSQKPQHGSLTLNADGSFSYRPWQGFDGIDEFRYVAFDGKGGGAMATVRLQVVETSSGTRNASSDNEPVRTMNTGMNARIEALLRHGSISLPESRPRR